MSEEQPVWLKLTTPKYTETIRQLRWMADQEKRSLTNMLSILVEEGYKHRHLEAR